MMKRHWYLSLLALLCCELAVADPSQEAAATIEAVAERLEARPNPTEWIDDYVAFDRVGRFVLGRQARILDPADRQRFNSRYTLLLKGTLQKEMLRLQVSEFEIISVTSRSERDQIVHTRVKTQDGRTEDLRFRLIKTEDGWRIVDLQALGLWLAIEQRAQIGALFDVHGGDVAAVLSELESASRAS